MLTAKGIFPLGQLIPESFSQPVSRHFGTNFPLLNPQCLNVDFMSGPASVYQHPPAQRVIPNSSLNRFTPLREHFPTDLKAIRILTDYLFSRLCFLHVSSSHPGNSRGSGVSSSSSSLQAGTAIAPLVRKIRNISFQTTHQRLQRLSIPLFCDHC